QHAGELHVVEVDQSAQDGWALEGDFQFAAGPDQWVRLEDYTGEDLSTNTQIVFDAVKLTRLDPVVEPDAGAPDGGARLDAGDATGLDASQSDAGEDPDPRSAGGCSCKAGDSSEGGPVGLLFGLILVTLMARRRRRDHPVR
ncbi:MAG: MYXO-CTERM sorting domain-containing protein, partial [Polyangia bacterium]|nr:MYXO-CTERM sorting domain-containing protein [Polyangia bacterium]